MAVPVFADALTAEQAQQACPLLPQVQAWTDQAALTVSSEQPSLNAQNRGIAIHEVVKNEVLSKRRDFPFAYRGVSAEYSIATDGKPGRYAAAGTKRLDVIDRIPPEDPKVICDFEIKTGDARMGRKQLNDYIVFHRCDESRRDHLCVPGWPNLQAAQMTVSEEAGNLPGI